MIRFALVTILSFAFYTGVSQTLPTTTAPASLTTDSRPTAIPEAKKQNALESVGKMLGVESTVDEAKKLQNLVTEDLPDLGLKVKQAKKEAVEKHRKKKLLRTEYEGLPIAEAYTKFGSGDKTIVEKFTVLKQYRQPSPYVRDIFWYDAKEQRVKSSVIKDKEKALILHGPYRRYQNGTLTDEGFYYLGAKDGRWEKYDATYQLLDKAKYDRGFPAESQVTYYDSAHTKIKEVLPREFGKLHGTYFAFYESGQPAAEGRYDHGVKVGRWTEYYPLRRTKKRVTQYPASRWDEEFEPYLLSEWDERGKVVYERPKEKEVAEEEQ